MMENGLKRKRDCSYLINDGFDRISNLPDCILNHILTFLSTKDGCRTNILSKRWKPLWSLDSLRICNLPDTILRRILCFLPTEDVLRLTFLSKRWKFLCSPPFPVLDLDFNRFVKSFNILQSDDKKKRFIDFVESMIELHGGHHLLQKLRLAFDISIFGRTKFPTRKWVKFAMKCNCLKLDLDLSIGDHIEERNYEKPHVLPPPYKGADPVTVMNLKYCKFAPFNYQGYTCLKTLIMTACKIKKYSMSEMLYGCPVLEELHVIECVVSSVDVFEFYVHYSKLKCLVLDSCYGTEGYISSILIDYPSLSKFKYVGEMLEKLQFRNLKKLIEAEIYFQTGSISYDHNVMLHNLLVNMAHVNTLKLCRWSLKLLGTGDELQEGLQLPLDNLKQLTVSTCLGDFEHKGLACLLRSAPHLETLSVDLSPARFESFIYWEAQPVSFACLHIKEVEIKGFQGLHNEMEFIEYILKHASVLKKMIIYLAAMEEPTCDLVKLDSNERQNLRLLQADREVAVANLFSLTRSSPAAQILLT